MDAFRGRVAVVTGGAGGIGMAMARAFAARGASLVLADLDEGALERARAELAPSGAPLLTVPTDVTKLGSVAALAAAAEKRFGAVHVLCNNAGVAVYGEIAEATHRDWQYVMNVDFWGVVHGVETFVPLLLEQKQGGHIVNTASMAGLVGMRWLGIYSAAKFAVVGLSEALHRELKPHGIGVSVLCPMIVATDIDRNSARMRPSDLTNPGNASTQEPAVDKGGAGREPVEFTSTGDAHRSGGREAADAHGGEPKMVGGTITAEQVAQRVVRGIERGDLHILTHPEQREILRRRAAKLDAMFEEDMW